MKIINRTIRYLEEFMIEGDKEIGRDQLISLYRRRRKSEEVLWEICFPSEDHYYGHDLHNDWCWQIIDQKTNKSNYDKLENYIKKGKFYD